jgi:hypothetical protein
VPWAAVIFTTVAAGGAYSVTCFRHRSTLSAMKAEVVVSSCQAADTESVPFSGRDFWSNSSKRLPANRLTAPEWVSGFASRRFQNAQSRGGHTMARVLCRHGLVAAA